MKSGPRPKPTPLKILQGTDRADRRRNEPQPERQAPPCPEWLRPGARKKWAELAPRLERLGLLTEIDGDAFAAYCHWWDVWQRAERLIQKRGSVFRTPAGYVTQRPEVAIARKAWQEVYKLATHFGFSPSSRSRIDMPAPEVRDPLDEFLDGA